MGRWLGENGACIATGGVAQGHRAKELCVLEGRRRFSFSALSSCSHSVMCHRITWDMIMAPHQLCPGGHQAQHHQLGQQGLSCFALPHLQNCRQFRAPQYKKDMKPLECPKKAMRMGKGLKRKLCEEQLRTLGCSAGEEESEGRAHCGFQHLPKGQHSSSIYCL